ncbi:MAG: OmpA family protein [Bacteroidia bacterium]|nr:OmpA family protein [Bacteroidia bacterium]
MRKASLAIFLSLFFCILSPISKGQNLQHPWAVGGGFVLLKYKAPADLPALQAAAFQSAYQLSLSKRLGGAFDFRTQITYANNIEFPAPLDETPSNTINTQLVDMSYLLGFKVNNGVFMKEDAFLGPYVLFGLGGSYVQMNPDVYIPLGGGLKFRLSDRLDIRLESTRKFSVNKDYQHTAHALSVHYNVGKAKEKYPKQEINEEKIIEETKPKDADEDGIADEDDLCPEVPGIERLFGCPEEEEEENIAEETDAQPEKLPQGSPEVKQEEAEEQKIPIQQEKEEVLVEDHSKAKAIPPAQEELAQREVQIESSPEPLYSPQKNNTHTEVAEEEKLPCNLSLTSTDFSIYFEHASADLPARAKQKLDEIAALLQACKSSKLQLQGHTDATGADKSNQVLSVLRAHKVKYYLVYEHGIRQNRIDSEGFGESKPKASNNTDTGRERNRRVDFKVIR